MGAGGRLPRPSTMTPSSSCLFCVWLVGMDWGSGAHVCTIYVHPRSGDSSLKKKVTIVNY